MKTIRKSGSGSSSTQGWIKVTGLAEAGRGVSPKRRCLGRCGRLGEVSLPELARWALAAALVLAFTGNAPAGSCPIPLSETGAKATADYQGDALGVVATAEGARLWCDFQKLEGQATGEGLWLESSEPGGGKLRLVATAVGREEAADEWVASPMDTQGPGMARQRLGVRWVRLLLITIYAP